jgi:small subunit ribosomal protein S5
MTEEIKQNTENTGAPSTEAKPFERRPFVKREGGFQKGGFNRGGKGGDRKGGFRDKPKPEFEQKLLQARRVTRVVSGGRRYSQAVAIVVGDKKGRVGLGTGKAIDTTLAIDKAYRQAVKKMVNLKLNKNFSIPHELSGKFNSCRVNMFPNKGRGLIAGSAARVILNLAGVQNITAKFHSPSKNKLNNAKAAMDALSLISTPFVRQPKKDFEKNGEGRDGQRRFERRDGQGRGTGRGPSRNFVRRPFNNNLRNPQVAPATSTETKVETSTIKSE